MKTFKTIVTFKNGNTGVQLTNVDVIYVAEATICISGMSISAPITITLDEYLKYSEYIEKREENPREAKKIADYRKKVEYMMNYSKQILSGCLMIVK